MKTNKLFKNILMIGAFLLLWVGTTQTASAQTQAAKPNHLYHNTVTPIKVGDSIMIHQDSLYYLTGERMSKWVYKVPHPVQQVGGKRYPYGILIGGIYSWVYPGSLIPLKPTEPAPEPTPESTDTTQVTDSTATTQEGATQVTDSTATTQDGATQVTDSTATTQEGVTQLTDSTATTTEGSSKTGPIDINNTGRYNIPVPYQVNRFSLGLRGGFASTLQDASNFPLGYDVALDLRYAHLWAGDKNKPELGIMTGLNVSYVHTKHHMAINDAYTLPTVDGDVYYNVTADKVVEKVNEVIFEIPVMFTMVTTDGFFLNVGPKFMLPIYSGFRQKITNPNITAYLEELNGKPILNNPVMGFVSDEQMDMRGTLNNELKFSLALGAELGYEFKFKNGNSLDLGAYVDYSVYSAYKNVNPSSVISITPPTSYSSAIVDVQSMTNALSHKVGLFDVGVKLAYNFNFEVTKK